MLLLLVITVASAAIGCQPEEPPLAVVEREAPATLVVTERLRRGTFDDRWYVVSGPTEPRKVFQCGFELGGRVTAVEVEEGDKVGPEQTLATLDLGYHQRRVREATIAWQQADADHVRLSGVGSEIFPTADIERAQRNLEAAKVALELAQEEFKKATCKSPPGFEKGVIEHRLIDPGEVVMPGQAVFTIVDSSVVRLFVRVPGRIAAMIAEDVTRAEVVIEDLPGRTSVFPAGDPSGMALVTRIPTMADAAHQFAVEISIDNSDGRIRPGMIGRARVHLPPLEEVTIVPAVSVIREGDIYVAWLAADDRAIRWSFPAATTVVQGDRLLTPAIPPSGRLIVEGFQELIANARIREE